MIFASIDGNPIFQIMSLPQSQENWRLPDSCPSIIGMEPTIVDFDMNLARSITCTPIFPNFRAVIVNA
jgi:hypothetical protein